ncbi:MAG TPA: Hsp70 family protein, partial [Polyangiales bacterium]|nr:Hsp70 family protein [Polyangiales bacterium]
TVIPVSRSERFQTLGDNQTQIEIEVYQGEHSLCRDNQKLGAFVLDGLPRKPAGSVSIEVRFTYDLNGLLEVEATVPDTDNKRSLLIEKRPGALSAKQIEEARSAMKKLKFHPRDALPNRTALARADAVFAELTGDARDQLGAGIAYLRGALDSQDPAEINEARERLNALTDALRRR